LLILNCLKGFNCGATDLGIFIGQTFHQEFEGAGTTASGKVVDGLAPVLRFPRFQS
jgi:hypothetical protein